MRGGLNAGEPIAEEGDLLGTAVNMAARIAAMAGGGQILVSDVVRQLVAGKGFLFADHGEFVAKGFEEPVRGIRSELAGERLMDAPPIQYVKTSDGVNIAYTTAGGGPPVVWILNAFLSHVQLTWEQPVLRAAFEAMLSTGATLVQFDPRGSGLSDRDVADISTIATVHDLEAVVDRLQLDRFVIVGFEWGSAIAIRYATTHPERVSRIVIANPPLGPGWQTPRGNKWMELVDDWELLTETVASMAFGFGFEESQRYAAFIRAAMDHDTFRRFILVDELDLLDLAKQIHAPTLIVRHTGVTWVSMESTRALAAAIPNCTMVAIDGIYTDHPGQTGRAIRGDFMGLELQPALNAAPDGPQLSSFRTVLFTDLVGHTEMMSRLGDDRGRDVLREHERITREVLKANGGTEVKTMGDGFMASFGSVTKAVECAIALQRAFADREGEPLNVRVGLNAGEPIEEDGDLLRRNGDPGVAHRGEGGGRRDPGGGHRPRPLLRQRLPLRGPRGVRREGLEEPGAGVRSELAPYDCSCLAARPLLGVRDQRCIRQST